MQSTPRFIGTDKHGVPFDLVPDGWPIVFGEPMRHLWPCRCPNQRQSPLAVHPDFCPWDCPPDESWYVVSTIRGAKLANKFTGVCDYRPGDLTKNGVVDLDDLITVLQWFQLPEQSFLDDPAPYCLGDGRVDMDDILVVMLEIEHRKE